MKGATWCKVHAVTRISVDVNDEWLEAARAELGTDTKVETINAALHEFAARKRAKDLIATLDDITLDVSGSAGAWRYGGGRDLTTLADDARAAHSA
jgi:hypothetical protein